MPPYLVSTHPTRRRSKQHAACDLWCRDDSRQESRQKADLVGGAMWLITLPCPTGRVSVCDCSWLGISEGTSSRLVVPSLPKPTTDPTPKFQPTYKAAFTGSPTTDSCLESGKQPDIFLCVFPIFTLWVLFWALPCPSLPTMAAWEDCWHKYDESGVFHLSIYFALAALCLGCLPGCGSDSYVIPWQYVFTNLTCNVFQSLRPVRYSLGIHN